MEVLACHDASAELSFLPFGDGVDDVRGKP
jgi:hypothetical protein